MDAQEPATKKLGTTAYAVLGMLALRDWTTYELVQQMERTIGMWAPSQSMVYEEPKHLVAQGYATVHDTPVGRRPRSRYSITDAGRRALADWLAVQPEPPALQFEGLLKILFSDQGDPDTNRKVLGALSDYAHEARRAAGDRARSYLEGDYIAGIDLAGRAAILAQTLAFLAEFYQLIDRWSTWATQLATSPESSAQARRVFTAIAEGRRVVR